MTISEPSAYRNFSFGNLSPKLWVNLRVKNMAAYIKLENAVGKSKSWKVLSWKMRLEDFESKLKSGKPSSQN